MNTTSSAPERISIPTDVFSSLVSCVTLAATTIPTLVLADNPDLRKTAMAVAAAQEILRAVIDELPIVQSKPIH